MRKTIKDRERDINMGYSAADMVKAANAIGRLKKELNNSYRYGEVEDIQDKYIKHKDICYSLNELYISKNKEYGDSFGKAYRKFGRTSSITQIFHKMERVYEIYDKENINHESLEDNLIDAANYIVMLLVEMEMEQDAK